MTVIKRSGRVDYVLRNLAAEFELKFIYLL